METKPIDRMRHVCYARMENRRCRKRILVQGCTRSNKTIEISHESSSLLPFFSLPSLQLLRIDARVSRRNVSYAAHKSAKVFKITIDRVNLNGRGVIHGVTRRKPT